MIKVKDIMTTDLITLTLDMDIVTAGNILLENKINGAPVLDENGGLVGILCQSDLIAQQKKLPIPTVFTLLDSVIQLTSKKQIEKQVRKITALTVSDAMTPNPVTVNPDSMLETVAALMIESNFHTLPVLDNGRLVGIIGKEDILRNLLSPLSDHQEKQS
jgi:CBS domain-containing protein